MQSSQRKQKCTNRCCCFSTTPERKVFRTKGLTFSKSSPCYLRNLITSYFVRLLFRQFLPRLICVMQDTRTTKQAARSPQICQYIDRIPENHDMGRVASWLFNWAQAHIQDRIEGRSVLSGSRLLRWRQSCASRGISCFIVQPVGTDYPAYM